MKFSASTFISLALLFTYSTSALPAVDVAQAGTTRYPPHGPLGVDAAAAPSLEAQYGQSYADHLGSYRTPLQKRAAVILCGGLQIATQCGSAGNGLGRCADSYSLRILDESQRATMNQAKVYVYDGYVKDANVNPCAKDYLAKKGNKSDRIGLICNVDDWSKKKNGDALGLAARLVGDKQDWFWCHRVIEGGARNWCVRNPPAGTLSFFNRRDFECVPW